MFLKSQKDQKILVTHFRTFGDHVLATPFYRGLKRAYPNAKVTVAMYRENLPILEGHPGIDAFILCDRKEGFLSQIRKIRGFSYDLVINLESYDRGAIAALLARGKKKVGMELTGKSRKLNRFFSKTALSTPTERHMVERNLDVLRTMGITPEDADKELWTPMSDAAREKVNKLIPYDHYVIVHPASRCTYKHWTEENFGKLIQYLHSKGENIVLSGGPGEEERNYLESIIRCAGNVPICNVAGMLKLDEMGALIDGSKMLIGVDSVPPHIASALKKPAIVLFGPTNDLKWGPWKNPFGRVVRMDVPCKRCDQAGCGGSGISDCLIRLPLQMVVNTYEELSEVVRNESPALSSDS